MVGLSGRLFAANPSGFLVPAEGARHQRSFMQWPVNRQVQPDPVFLERVQQRITDIANAISDFGQVTVLAAKSNHATARA